MVKLIRSQGLVQEVQVGHGQQAVFLFKAFGKIGGTGKS